MQIKINRKEIEVFENETIIEAARRNGIEIPALCYVFGYHHHPSCMVCVVKNCDTGLIVPSCSTVVTEGMSIDSESEEVTELRRMALELLLSDHLATCRPPCNPKNCKLPKYAAVYHAKWNKYPRSSANQSAPPQHIKGNLRFDAAKCIKCGLCVYNSNNGFTFKNRGFGMEVVLPEENKNNIEESLCEICPTQALYKSML